MCITVHTHIHHPTHTSHRSKYSLDSYDELLHMCVTNYCIIIHMLHMCVIIRIFLASCMPGSEKKIHYK